MSALEQILSIPSIKFEHPRLYAQAVKELEELRKAAQQGVQRTCATCGAIDMFSDNVCIECGASR